MNKEIEANKIIDLKGKVCPFPWVSSKKTLSKMQVGQILKIIVDHAPASENIPKYFKEEGQEIIGVDKINELDWQIVVKQEK